MAAAAAAAPRTYVDFVPPHQLVEEADKKVLQIDLSGQEFKKEQLRVQIDNHRRLRTSGERQVSGNQWTRFYKEFQVPEDCNDGEVRARFNSRDQVLYITMSKLSPEEAEEPKAPAAAGSNDQGAAAPAGSGAAAAQAQRTAAQAEEKDQEEDKDTSHDGGNDGGREQATVTGRTKTPWTVLLAVVLALVAAAGFYAKYRLMDPSSAEPAPADAVHLFNLSDH